MAVSLVVLAMVVVAQGRELGLKIEPDGIKDLGPCAKRRGRWDLMELGLIGCRRRRSGRHGWFMLCELQQSEQ
ncbi:hypothetical protein CCACVL1_26703 [Corchorus capsularis]|uniref:Uncharacterized protein n=1 Tax=Corchorus capsularis TaxID=210143 RepID=A0A1R3GDI3_COCAP|nr:hypothetical protein CCACVL1_26703 [Corchorus capsularis]